MLFFLVAVSILFGCCFKLNVFTIKISNLLLPFGAKGGVEAMNFDISIPYFCFLVLVAFALKHNVDENNTRNIDVRIHIKLELQEIGC